MFSTSYHFFLREKAYKTNFLIILSSTWLHIAIYGIIAVREFSKFLQMFFQNNQPTKPKKYI